MLKYLFYVALFTLSLGQLASISKTQGLNIYLFDLVVGFFCVYGILHYIIGKKLIIPKYFILFIVFSFVALISLLYNIEGYSSTELGVSSFYLIRWVVYLFSAIVIHNMLKFKDISESDVVKAILLSGLFISLIGFVQLIVLPDFEILDPLLGWDPHKNRLVSTFFDPNYVGAYLALIMSLIIGLYFIQPRVWYIPYFLIMLFALFFTFSRSAWLMFAIVVFIYGLFKSRIFLLLAICIMFLAYFAVPRVQTRISGVTDPSDSAHFRIISWKNTLEISNDNLFLGVGYNSFRYAQKEYGVFDPGTVGGHSGAGSDSSFLLILATTGIIGLLIFTLGYFFPIFDSILYSNPYKLIVVASFLGLFVESQFVNSLFYPQILFLWLLFLALFEPKINSEISSSS